MVSVFSDAILGRRLFSYCYERNNTSAKLSDHIDVSPSGEIRLRVNCSPVDKFKGKIQADSVLIREHPPSELVSTSR